MGKLTELAWDAFTLKHVEHKNFVLSYLIFLSILLLFEIFLFLFYVFASVIFIQYSFMPNFIFFLSGVFLLLVIVATIPVILQIIKKWRKFQ
ncbi:hypothetical protein [Pallidibacillus pasinlerensis]|uniref:Uncharacterized protein n=1 Tax=Pallidibacillus pasinlerensis TaxID=2703818 RepID=A0ABX0A4F4_9BACI|nr:hypothetical protein [Pallidibacillus pasinlerensis]NCU18320.1 hypothetical protein [Pallidibacillus pasinlerensis]